MDTREHLTNLIALLQRKSEKYTALMRKAENKGKTADAMYYRGLVTGLDTAVMEIVKTRQVAK